jgi:hypothetical protein
MGSCCGKYLTIQAGDQKTIVGRDGKVTVVKGPVRYKIPRRMLCVERKRQTFDLFFLFESFYFIF